MPSKVELLLTLWSTLAVLILAGAPDKPKNASDAPDTIKVDKRSQEDIMFGNQQNKASTIVDDLLDMQDSKEATGLDTNDTRGEEVKKDGGGLLPEPSGNDYASYLPPAAIVPEDRGGYEVDNPAAAASGVMDPQILYDIPDLGDYPPYDVTNALYRRKRNLSSQPLLLRKRSFRSSLGQLMGRRMSRSVLRPKRHTPSLYDMNTFYDDRDLPSYSLPWLDQPVMESEELVDPEPAATPILYVPPRQRRTYWYPPDYRYVRLAKRGDGRWGRFETKESPSEDMLRLYALANLLADTEQPEYRFRRSAAPLAMA